MLDYSFTLVILVGAALGAGLSIFAHSRPRPKFVFAVGLVIAALVYVVFSSVAMDVRALILELGAVAAFSLIAWAGARGSAAWLAVGWAGHVAWDLLVHPVGHSAYAPWWYPLLCIGFDLTVAGAILPMAFGSQRIVGTRG